MKDKKQCKLSTKYLNKFVNYVNYYNDNIVIII